MDEDRPVGRAARASAYDAALTDGLPAACLVVAAAFTVMGLWHPWALAREDAAVMTPLAVGTALLALLTWAALRRRSLRPGWSHTCAAALAVPVVGNCVVHYALTGDPHLSVNVTLIVVGLGVFFVDLRWVVSLMAVTAGTWLATLVVAGASGGEIGRAVSDLVIAAAAGLMANAVRRRSLLRLLGAQNDLHALAHRDELTGLLNRRGFLIAAQRRLDTGEPTTLCFVDVDNLKVINDAYGHDAGDLALVTVADALREAFPRALLSRLAGDEFALATDVEGLDAADDSALTQLASRITAAGERIRLPLSISVGTATSGEGRTLSQLLAAADAAMYGAKAGRAPADVGRTGTGPTGTGGPRHAPPEAG